MGGALQAMTVTDAGRLAGQALGSRTGPSEGMRRAAVHFGHDRWGEDAQRLVPHVGLGLDAVITAAQTRHGIYLLPPCPIWGVGRRDHHNVLRWYELDLQYFCCT